MTRTKGTRRARQGRQGGLSGLRARLGRVAACRGAIRLYLAVAVLASVHLAGLGLWSYVTGLPQHQVDIGALRILERPEWMPERVAAEIRVPPELAGVYSIFEPELVGRVAEGFTANPWVRQVHQVRKEYPNTIYVSLDLRRPVAVVEIGNVLYLVDREEMRLPWSDLGPSDFPDPLPYIRGVSTSAPPIGEPWVDDEALSGGIEVAAIVLESPVLRDEVEIAEIDVKNAARSIVLVARSGGKIKWGRATRSDRLKFTSQERREVLENALRDGILRQYPKLAGMGTRALSIEFGFPKIE